MITVINGNPTFQSDQMTAAADVKTPWRPLTKREWKGAEEDETRKETEIKHQTKRENLKKVRKKRWEEEREKEEAIAGRHGDMKQTTDRCLRSRIGPAAFLKHRQVWAVDEYEFFSGFKLQDLDMDIGGFLPLPLRDTRGYEWDT